MEVETTESNKGIDKMRIVNSSSSKNTIDTLLCKICTMIPYKPVSCSKCETHFCRSCIKNWLNQNQTKRNVCPNNCIYEEKKSLNIMNNLLSKLLVKCRYYEDGCTATLPYESIFNHEQICQNNSFLCTFCGKQMPGKAKNGHLEHSCIGDLQYTNKQLKKENQLLKDNFKKEVKENNEYKKIYKDLLTNTSELSIVTSRSEEEDTVVLPYSAEKIKRLYLEWLSSKQIKFSNIEIIFQDNEFMIYSKENLNAGDQIMFIPRSQVFSFNSIQDSDIVKKLKKLASSKKEKIQNEDLLSLSTWYLNEKLLQNFTGTYISTYSNLLNIYPQLFSNSVLGYKEKTINFLKGSVLFHEVKEAQAIMKSHWEMTNPLFHNLKYKNFLWAYHNIYSKNILFKNELLMIPLLDLLPPDIPGNNQTLLEYDSILDGFRLSANKTILKNRRIVNSYLNYNNRELLIKYGIVFENNVLDDFEVYLFFNDFDSLINIKKSILENKDEPFIFKLKNNFKIDNIGLLFAFMRIIEATDKSELLQDLGCYIRNAISVENEKKVLKKLELIFKNKLASYETDCSQDEKLLASKKLCTNERNCVFVRNCEKKIISNFINFISMGQKYLSKTLMINSQNKDMYNDIHGYLKIIDNLKSF